MNAHAYAVGNDITFGAGRYAPETSDARLIAHELTHVMQQSSERRGEQLRSKLTINQSGDAFEQEADAEAGRDMAGTHTS